MSNGFEEIETISVIDILRRGGVHIDVAGLDSIILTGSHDIKLTADNTLENILSKDELYDMLIFTGGYNNMINLTSSDYVLELAAIYNARGNYIGAICAAPAVLAKSGIIGNRYATIYDGMEKYLPSGSYKGDNIVVSENLITARGPAYSFQFAFTLLEHLVSKDVYDKIYKDMLFNS